MITVVNKYKHTPTENDVYIGRGSVLGNPFTSIQDRQTKAEFICGSREESVDSFREYLLKKISEKDKRICDEFNSSFSSSILDSNFIRSSWLITLYSLGLFSSFNQLLYLL